jgi:hypothetical protein
MTNNLYVRKLPGRPQLAEDLLASQGLCSMQLVSTIAKCVEVMSRLQIYIQQQTKTD